MSQGAMAVNDQDVEANRDTSQIRNTSSEIQLLPWRKTKVPTLVKPPQNPTDIPESHLAWILADKLDAPEFSRFAVANFISHSECVESEGTFQCIQDNTMENSALAVYARKWKVHQENKGSARESVDPGAWEIDHWYTSCSQDIGPCRHQSNVAVQRHQDPSYGSNAWMIYLPLGLLLLGAVGGGITLLVYFYYVIIPVAVGLLFIGFLIVCCLVN